MSQPSTSTSNTLSDRLSQLSEIQVQFNFGPTTKSIHVSMPDRTQWISRQRRRPIEIIQLGRGLSENKVRENRDEDLRIYNLIKSPDSPDLDEYEASLLITNLSKASVSSIVPDPEGYLIDLETVAGSFQFLLKHPSVKDWQIYVETRSKVLSGKNTEIHINLAAAERLFDEVAVDIGKPTLPLIPILWKAAASAALIESVENSFMGGGTSSPLDDSEDLFRTGPAR